MSTTPVPDSHPRPYADSVVGYRRAGWTCILPVPPETKTPPPPGFTGAEGRDTTDLDLVHLVESHGHFSVALRMPTFPATEETGGLAWCVIGIDVDHYIKGETTKRGADTIQVLEAELGALPPTWSSTARGLEDGRGGLTVGPSRIMLFRAPAQRYATKLTAPEPYSTGGGQPGRQLGDVEVIQRHHRYAVVWPSPHPSTGRAGAIYRWYTPEGHLSEVGHVPRPTDLAWLPPAWARHLAEGAAAASLPSSDPASGYAMLQQLLEDTRPECAEVTNARLTAAHELDKAEAGSRHDVMTARVHHLVQIAAQGHAGVSWALSELRGAWDTITAGEHRGEEFERMLLTSARKAVTSVGHHQVPRDPCLFLGSYLVPGITPDGGVPGSEGGPDGEGAGDPQEPIEQARIYAVHELIGAHAFDPNAGLDQTLAEAVLERMHPVIRYAWDADAWLLREPQRWVLRRSLAAWAVSRLAPLMPWGDLTAEKDSEPYARAQRRQRFMTNGAAKSIASKMEAVVSAGLHPASLELARLDADPEILWAGGMPYHLRACAEGPAFADARVVDPATPHLHAAGTSPEAVPTPLWDAFLAAVWPDPAIRAWAIRVLSICLTGYADRALPILLGETGRGKTQVIALIMSVLGSYAHAANPKLLSPNSNEHDTIVFDLKGRRMSFIDEAPSEAKTGQERLKQLTGGGELTGRRMNQDPITFVPTHTFVLTSNDEPTLTDPAVRSRARLIPCAGDPEAVRAARAAIGHVSGPAWRAEAPGVLAGLMAEAACWLADPSSALVTAAPESIRYLAENIGAEQDPVAVWVAEETAPDEAGTPSRELYQAFTSSCMRNNLRRDAIPSETKWGRALTRLGFPSHHSETGKRRQLRVRSGGFLPGMGSPTPPAVSLPPVNSAAGPESTGTAPDGLSPNPDGFLTGHGPQPVSAFPQVNPSESVAPDGSDGFEASPTHVRAQAHTGTPAQERRLQIAPNPSVAPSIPTDRTQPDLREQAPDGLFALHPSAARPVSEPTTTTEEVTKKAAEPTERAKKATESAAAKRAAAKAEKLAAAAGPSLALPVVLLRTGELRAGDGVAIDALLTTITGEGGHGELTVDVETTGYPIGHADFALRTVQLGDEHLAVVLDPHDTTPGGQADVARRHLAAARVLHAHSATADLIPLALAGLLDLESGWDRMDDTVVWAKLVDPQLTGSDPSLKQISKAMLGEAALSAPADEARKALFKAGGWLTDTKVTTPVARSGWAQVDPTCETQLRYAASDVLDDAAIARRLPPVPTEQWHRERTAQRMTARIAHRGLRVDGEQVQRLLATHTAAREDYADMVRQYGVENPGSDQQVGDALTRLGAALPRTATGKASVAKSVLNPLRHAEGAVGDLAAAVLDFRHHDTAVGTFLEPYHQLVVNGDGRARPTVYTLGADTGRMSCVRPNLQQVPREGGFRACITADPGHVLISADFSGVELRVAAALSGDANLAAIVADPARDIHREIAQVVWGPNAGKAERYQAKRKVFGRLYGSGITGLVTSDPPVSEAVAHAIVDAMDQMTPGLSEWSRMVSGGVRAGRTQFQTYSGRVIHLAKNEPHKAPNYCIQGTARELLIDALLRWRETPWGDATLLPVHDELVVMVPEADATAATQALVAAMTTNLHGIDIKVDPSTPSYAWADSV